MQVVLHTGAYCTDQDRLLKCLLRNANAWRHDGVSIPGPGKYRKILSDTVNALSDRTPSPEARDVLVDAILAEDPDQVERLVLSHEGIFGVPKMLLGNGTFYRHADSRVATIRQIFHSDSLEIFMGLRNPATFLPAVFAKTPYSRFDEFLSGVDPLHLRWSEVLARIRMAAPDVPLTVWCNEDTPIVWGEVVRELGGIELSRKIVGAFDVMARIISRDGMKRFRKFLHENPGMNEMQKRRVMTAFLDKYALEEELEEEVDLPNWSDDYVDTLTEIYDEDVERIANMPGVSLITP